VVWRILPFLIVCYLIAIIYRGNIGMASLQINENLGLSKAVFGFASNLFFVSYFLFEVTSNLAMQKIGKRSGSLASWCREALFRSVLLLLKVPTRSTYCAFYWAQSKQEFSLA